MPNLVDEYKTIFLEKRGKPWNFPKTFSLCWSFLEICFEVYQESKSNILSPGILVQGFIMPNLFHKYKKKYFWEGKADLETLPKLSPKIKVTYKLVLESVINLSWLWLLFFWIFLNVEYWTVAY